MVSHSSLCVLNLNTFSEPRFWSCSNSRGHKYFPGEGHAGGSLFSVVREQKMTVQQLRDVWIAEVSKSPTRARVDALPGLSRTTLDVIGLAGALPSTPY